jgi:hypothetical protein
MGLKMCTNLFLFALMLGCGQKNTSESLDSNSGGESVPKSAQYKVDTGSSDEVAEVFDGPDGAAPPPPKLIDLPSPPPKPEM